QEVMRLILEAYCEPQFSKASHGFRPNRGCHTALTAIERPWTGTKWFIEGDITDCFGSIDHEILLLLRTMPSREPDDPDYRRLKYVRYADDFLPGFTGHKAESQEIKDKLHHFLRDNLKLELSMEKTKITHAQTEVARFLGYEIKTRHNDDRIGKADDGDRSHRRTVNGK